MFALRQIIDDPGEFIPVPAEVKHRRTEVIFLVVDPAPSAVTDDQGSEIKDPGVAQFFGCLPDFPLRDSQGEYESRESLS